MAFYVEALAQGLTPSYWLFLMLLGDILRSYYFHPYFTGENTEVQRGYVNCLPYN